MKKPKSNNNITKEKAGNSLIPPLRITTELKELITKAIETLNKDGYMEITIAQFCRQSLRFYSNQCINNQVGLAFKPN